MSIEKIWILAEENDGAPITARLELRQPRTDTGRLRWPPWPGAATAAGMAATLGEHGATTVYDVGDLGGALPGVPVAAAMAALVEGGTAPDAILFPATYDGRDIAGRLSVMLDRPVLTNVVGLTEADGGLTSTHTIFGGSHRS